MLPDIDSNKVVQHLRYEISGCPFTPVAKPDSSRDHNNRAATLFADLSLTNGNLALLMLFPDSHASRLD